MHGQTDGPFKDDKNHEFSLNLELWFNEYF